MKKILIALVVLVAAVFAVISFVRPIAKVATVISGKAPNAVPGSVTVQAEFKMELKSEVGGRLLSSTLVPGDRVTKGAVLAQLDTGDLKLAIEQNQIDLEAARKSIAVGSSIKLELQSAREGLANSERLAKMGVFALGELEKQRRSVQQIEQKLALEDVQNAQKVDTLENSLKVKQRQLEKMTIVAQFDGVVSLVFARPGDLISAGTPIAVLISTSRTVEAMISEENFSGVRVGQRASVRFLPYGGWLYDATVTKILPTADPDTQRYIVFLDVKIEPEKLIPGITGEVTIIVAEHDHATIVPRRALFGNNLYVAVDGRVQLRTVEVGYVSLTAVEILKGVSPGEQVIVDELEKFRDHDRVRTELVPAK